MNCSQCTIQLKVQMPKHVFELTLNWTSEASVISCLGRQGCHRHGLKTVLAAQTAERTKCRVIFVVFFKFQIKNSGGKISINFS